MRPRARGTFHSHAAFSLLGAGISAVIALATLPYIVSELGLAAYGLFSLLSVVSGYIGALDLGFSWGTTRFLADAIERQDDKRIKDVLAASVSFHLAVGLVGAAIMGAVSYPLVHWVFNVPTELRGAGTTAGYLLAAAFPFSMFHALNTAAFRGARLFGYASLLQLFSSAGTALLIVAALALEGGLVAVCAAVAGWQLLIAAVGTILARRVYGSAYRAALPDRKLFVSLTSFSLATSVSSVSSNLLYLPNRLAVGVLLPVHFAGIFSVPLAIAQRLLVVPNTLVTAALPSLTASIAVHDEHAFWLTARRTLGWTLALMVPPLVLGIVWAPEILRLWLRIDSNDAVLVLRLSLAAVLLNSVTSVTGVLCDSAGAPRVPAIASVGAGFANVVLAFVLTATSGIAGAGFALPASIGVLGLLMLVLWRRTDLPRPGWPPASRRMIVLTLAILGGSSSFFLSAMVVQERVETLADLARYGLLSLGAAYALLVLVVVRVERGKRDRHGAEELHS